MLAEHGPDRRAEQVSHEEPVARVVLRRLRAAGRREDREPHVVLPCPLSVVPRAPAGLPWSPGYPSSVHHIIRGPYCMSSISPERPGDEARRRRRLTATIKDALRDLRNQLSLLNHRVGGRLNLREVDLDCLDLIARHGPLSPSALARRAGLHPATMTGILDRLDRGGWIERGRDPSDRRGVVVQAARGRGAEILRLYLVDSGMNTAMDQICAGSDDKDLQRLTGFLRRTADAARTAAETLTAS